MRRSVHFTLLSAVLCASVAHAGTTPEGQRWLEAKAQEKDVVKHSSGFFYRILKRGDESGKSPGPTDKTLCHYEGRLIDGTIFDSTYERAEPALFAPKQLIKGWRIAMQEMREGDKWELFLPAELAYGDKAKGKHIWPGSVLIFEVEMIEVNPPRTALDFLKDNYVLLIVAVLAMVYFAVNGESGVNSRNRMPLDAARSKDNPRVFMELRIGEEGPFRVVFEIFANVVPRTAENFRQLCTGEKDGYHYLNSTFHRIIPRFMAQGGDFTSGNGMGGKSIYGSTFEDEWDNGVIGHTERGLLSMANRGPNTNGSQFFITFKNTSFLDGRHVVFGAVEDGMDVLDRLEDIGSQGGRPQVPVTVVDCGEVS